MAAAIAGVVCAAQGELAQRPRCRSPSTPKSASQRFCAEEAEELSEIVVNEHSRNSLTLLHKRSLSQRLDGKKLERSSYAAVRSSAVSWLTKAFEAYHYRDEWLVATLFLLDRLAASSPRFAGGERPGALVPAEWLAAALSMLKLSSAEAELDMCLKEVIFELGQISKRSPDRERWDQVVKQEFRIYHILDFNVASPSPADFVAHIAFDVVLAVRRTSASASSSTPNAWPGLDTERPRGPRPELTTSVTRFTLLASFLVELGLAHAPEAAYRGPPVALALVAVRLALYAFGDPPIGGTDALKAAEEQTMKADGRQFLQELALELNGIWLSPPGDSVVISKWEDREKRFVHGRLPRPLPDAGVGQPFRTPERAPRRARTPLSNQLSSEKHSASAGCQPDSAGSLKKREQEDTTESSMNDMDLSPTQELAWRPDEETADADTRLLAAESTDKSADAAAQARSPDAQKAFAEVLESLEVLEEIHREPLQQPPAQVSPDPSQLPLTRFVASSFPAAVESSQDCQSAKELTVSSAPAAEQSALCGLLQRSRALHTLSQESVISSQAVERMAGHWYLHERNPAHHCAVEHVGAAYVAKKGSFSSSIKHPERPLPLTIEGDGDGKSPFLYVTERGCYVLESQSVDPQTGERLTWKHSLEEHRSIWCRRPVSSLPAMQAFRVKQSVQSLASDAPTVSISAPVKIEPALKPFRAPAVKRPAEVLAGDASSSVAPSIDNGSFLRKRLRKKSSCESICSVAAAAVAGRAQQAMRPFRIDRMNTAGANSRKAIGVHGPLAMADIVAMAEKVD